ncbi:MAG: hypothetical protein WDN69_24810 [Aliidongia sp.]
MVPAFAEGDDYEIPDDDTGTWIKTNPEIHASKATAAHQAYSNEWKGLVRMTKYWNNNARHWRETRQALLPDRGHGTPVPPWRLARPLRL